MDKIQFGFSDYTRSFSLWAKHHKTVGEWVYTIKERTGEVDSRTEHKKLLNLSDNHKDRLFPVYRIMYNTSTYESTTYVDYYFKLDNLEYPTPSFESYYVGDPRYEYTTHIRFSFLVGEARFYLDHKIKNSGATSTNLYDVLKFPDFITETIENVCYDVHNGKRDFYDAGIKWYEGDHFSVLAVEPSGNPKIYEVEEQDLYDSLVGVEIYDFTKERRSK
ncbi:hypothetical protein BH753_gp016 [Bacillus phage Shbh1]|uniref:Uncharacterized protein n=1 Tax=Bacillus phage Shbh1 TaxID=1796992 RepID=A0A142F141_9CAUD|nr:hypothetical protein BH753_gp016 [Bacillus phage Shbh1]AMQ66498.1 hypothetical protein [Bacillus phage Shbh1]